MKEAKKNNYFDTFCGVKKYHYSTHGGTLAIQIQMRVIKAKILKWKIVYEGKIILLVGWVGVCGGGGVGVGG